MRRPRIAARMLGACMRGAAAVEFAIVSGVLIALLIGILDLGRALWTQNQISFIADQAARHVLMHGNLDRAAIAKLRDQFTAGDMNDLEFQVPGHPVDGYLDIRIDYPFTLLVPQIAGEITLGVTRRVPAD